MAATRRPASACRAWSRSVASAWAPCQSRRSNRAARAPGQLRETGLPALYARRWSPPRGRRPRCRVGRTLGLSVNSVASGVRSAPDCGSMTASTLRCYRDLQAADRRRNDHHAGRHACRCPTSRSFRSSRATAPAPTSGGPRSTCSTHAVQRAYGGAPPIVWFEVLAGEKAKDRLDSWLPEDTLAAIVASPRRDQGPAHHAGRRRVPLAQRGPAAAARSLRLRPAGALLHRRAVAGQAAGRGEHGDLPREHGGHLRRHRVQGRDATRREASSSSCSSEMGVQTIRFPETSAIGIKPISEEGTKRLVRERHRVRDGPEAAERDAGAQGQHHEVHRGRLPGLGLPGRDARSTAPSRSTAGPWCRLPNGIVVKDVIADAFLQQILTRARRSTASSPR